MNDRLAFASLADIAASLRRKDYSSVELTQLYLDRIARHDAKANAYVTVFAEAALLTARAADIARQSGMPLPALHGIPIALKDLCDIEGHVATAGSAAWKSRRGTVTSTVVERLQAAGMIILGKLHMGEFAFSGWGTSPHMGTPRNPWDWHNHHRVPGGSSSGSGVAVAAGLTPAAIGSDTGGSVRIPAALNGVTGLKPTYGLISLHGVVPLAPSFDSIGTLTRTAHDAQLLVQALAGFDWRDPTTRLQPLSIQDPARPVPIEKMRIAVVQPSQYLGPVDARIQQATDQAARVFQALGADVQAVELPFDFAAMHRQWGVINAVQAYDLHKAYIEDADLPFDPWVRKRFVVGKTISAHEYVAAQAHRRRAIASFNEWMGTCDLILTPAVPSFAITLDEVDESQMPLGPHTRWVNYVGACALSLPAGFSDDGLPCSVQLVARGWHENTLLQAGQAFQRETDWHVRTPADLR